MSISDERANSNTREVENTGGERERLELERQKLALEVELKRRELADRKEKNWKELLANPLTLAIVGGIITLSISIITTYYSAKNARDSAERSLQTDLIKKSVEATRTEEVKKSLEFLVDVGLLPDYANKIEDFIKKTPEQLPTLGAWRDVPPNKAFCFQRVPTLIGAATLLPGGAVVGPCQGKAKTTSGARMRTIEDTINALREIVYMNTL